MRRYTELSLAVGILIAAVMCGLLSLTALSRDYTNENVLSPTITEAQQEENDVQAMEARYLAKEKADDKAELISFDNVQKMSKAARHKRPLWGKRKWPSYYHNVLGNNDVFLADEPKHPVHNLDIGDDDSAIESKEPVRGPSNRRRSYSRGGHSNRTPQHTERGRVHWETKSAPTQDLAELAVPRSSPFGQPHSHRYYAWWPRTASSSFQTFRTHVPEPPSPSLHCKGPQSLIPPLRRQLRTYRSSASRCRRGWSRGG